MKYGFIGCGNMGGAIASALATGDVDFAVSDRSGKAKDSGFPYCTPKEVAQKADRIFLAVKPQMMADVLAELSPILARRRPVLISMAAGLTMSRIASMAGGNYPVIRIMPNTPVAVGCGMTLYCANELVTREVLDDFLKDMAPTGRMDALEERLFDAAGTVSGCGPAYVYMFIEAMADGAVACGVPRAKAMEYAAAAIAGAGMFALKSGQHPGALKDAVCSPKGSTIQGLRILEQRGFRSAATDCVIATYEKNKEIAKN